ncbi:MAG: hypothetical protein NWQ43_06035 [Dolichospermum sp.]|nr:hypothetical protein [Dolichospermum sp.]
MSIYSPKAIRWNIGTSEYIDNIAKWWRNQNNQKFNVYHVVEYKSIFDEKNAQFVWEPVKTDNIGEEIIVNPNLELNNGWAFLSYNREKVIEAYAIDLDIERDNLFVWFGHPQQVIIFHKKR